MKSKHCLLFLILIAVIFAGPMQVTAKDITTEEARQVADNQLRLVLTRDGAWGDDESAELGPMQRLGENGRHLGYLFQIDPIGYIIVSPYRELAPVRAYSVRSNMDPAENGPLEQAFRSYQEIIHDGIASRLGRQPTPIENFSSVMPVDFEAAWRSLLDPDFVPAPPQRSGTRSVGMDYQEGETMLVTSWNQSPPYNDMCPDEGCVWGDYGYYNTNAWAGCVATAGAQVLKYWDWPPIGEGSGYDLAYDWPNMGWKYVYNSPDGLFWTHFGNGWAPTNQAQIDAVALLQRKVGVGVDMDYGCDGSLAQTHDLEFVFEDHFRIVSNMNKSARENYSYAAWVEKLMDEFNHNRPVVYRIPGHAVVADGWEEDLGVYLFHIVYGHNGSNDGWFSTGEIPGGGSTSEHYIMEEIKPQYCVSSTPFGPMTLPVSPYLPYRYFNEDVRAIDCQFAAGHNFQILDSDLSIEAMETDPSLGITFEGAIGNETIFFFDGNPTETTCIKINDGAIKMTMGGMLAVH